MRDAVDAWGQHGRTACEKRPSAAKTLPEEENPLVSLHTANAALSGLPAIRKTAGKPRCIAFTRFAARRCAPLPWNTALAVLACHMPEPASSSLWQVFYLPGWKTREACSAVRAMSLHRFTMEEGTRYSLREWICSPSGPMLQMVGTPRLELKPASDALS